ncbi:bifunctional folylpolyglutamate synthase/dihydrofolate synthase [Halofilum ochraceum]|uniref:bifunctional folylpolyglutamate synthase/dihydrofolate synthase n=1 Tax=Halofilum ochraceum TaxID=1611323 RepID=UPI0008DAF35E|nr:Mur ligase family protein [Halofilum ochraceum]
MTAKGPVGEDAIAAGWAWLATLPRAATAHTERGDDPLAAVRGLLAELDHPQRGLRVIHIAGSKGKGSTALYVESLLEALDLRTFTFTSPHLERWTERLRLNGAEAPPDRALGALHAVRDASHRCGIVPGFFEALTVAGLWLAAAERVDWCVIECGIGGRADATNIVEPAATIITGIEREHMDRLGHRLTDIAREKAGIVKPGAPLVAPRLAPELDAILASKSDAAGVPFLRVEQLTQPPAGAGAAGTDLAQWYYDRDGLIAAGAGWQLQASLAAPGTHMAGNAVLALASLNALGLVARGQMNHIATVLARTPLPGRMETVSERPWIIVDGAHTGASASALTRTIATLGARRLHLLLSCSAGKDLDAVLSPLLAEAAAVTVTRADPDWSLPAEALAEQVRAHQGQFAVEVIESPHEALAHACMDVPEGTLILATGSVYLAGAVRAHFPRDPSRHADLPESRHQGI